MTYDEIKSLNDLELKGALRKALGWPGGKNVFAIVPDYPCDLNAIRSAEMTLTPEQWATYIDRLYGDGGIQILADLSDIKEPEAYIRRVVFMALNFSAHQRAEALLWALTNGGEEKRDLRREMET
jgi:hypothetical protein